MKKYTYYELLEILFSLKGSLSKDGLQKMRFASHIMGDLHKKYLSIHIAGTNGKGSVATKIAYVLQNSGYKVGLFTSPHIHSFCERIKVNGQMIEKKEVEIAIEKIFALDKKHAIRLGFFEITTLLAFEYFYQKKVDIAVIETGLGGRYDATNIIHPILSIITSIGLDHTDILGNSLDLIAYEKAQIIKPHVPVILGPTARCSVIINYAKEKKSQILAVPFSFGFFDEENMQIARVALEKIQEKFSIKPKSFIYLKKRPECRYEVLFLSKEVILFDVAHNPQGFSRLFMQIARDFPQKKIHILFSMCHDKDVSQCISVIDKKRSFFYLFSTCHNRLLSANVLKKILQENNFKHICQFNCLAKAIDQAYSQLQRDGILLFCGSFYFMDEAKNLIKKNRSNDIHSIGLENFSNRNY